MTVEGANIASTFLASMFGASTANPVFICSLPNSDARDRKSGERHVSHAQTGSHRSVSAKVGSQGSRAVFLTATVNPARRRAAKKHSLN